VFDKIKNLFSKNDRKDATSQEEKLVPVIMPALSNILIAAEDKKGSPLTIEEATDIRDKAPAIMLPLSAKISMDESRGFRDVDPENLWFDWQMIRRDMGRKPDIDPGIRNNFVSNNNPIYQATIKQAQSTLEVFEGLIHELPETTHMIKTLVTDGDASSNLWMNDVIVTDEGFEATPFEVPNSFQTVKPGQIIKVEHSDVLDWMINDEGTAHGGFSIRFFREQKPENEHADYDGFIGVSQYAPIPKTAT